MFKDERDREGARDAAALKGKPLKERLVKRIAKYRKEGQNPLPKQMLRKYLAYAKHYCHPRLSKGACEIIQAFYLELREKGSSSDATPITTRQLDSMIRLSQVSCVDTSLLFLQLDRHAHALS